MFYKSALIRWMAIPACIVWGVLELLALQRVRFLSNLHKPTIR
jgi:hypothetical protein